MKKLFVIMLLVSTMVSYAQVPGEFVLINGGSFMMGSPANEAGRMSNEFRQEIRLSPFYMAIHEVTQALYQEVMGTNPSYFKGPNLPVEQVSWFEAIEFCNRLSEREGLRPVYTIHRDQIDPNNRNPGTNRWLVTWDRSANGYRLPTEAEWEFACRAGTVTAFNTGNAITSAEANYDGTRPHAGSARGVYRERTTAVGSFSPNAFGLYDMHGNVGEWCWDWNGEYPRGSQLNPTGAEFGVARVFRGGAWNSSGIFLRSARRSGLAPSNRGLHLGFRLVRNAQ